MKSRRHFLKQSLAAFSGLALAQSASAQWLRKRSTKVGIQLFTIPSLVSADFKGTMKKLSDLGYREIEFFGPYDFSAEETQAGWKQIAGMLGIKQNAFYGHSVPEVKAILKDNGLTTPSVHLDLLTMRTNIEAAAEALASLGTRYVAIPAIANPDDRSDYDRLADEFNRFGEAFAKHGVTFLYHNHGYEHIEKEGKTLMDTLLTQTDSKNVKFELDIFWMTAAGADPVAYLNKYPGRFKLMHIKDASEPVRFSGDGGDPSQWMPLFPKMADPGKGVFDLPAIIAAAKKSGVDHFYLERDVTPQPEVTLKDSVTYLAKNL